jgi:predicted nuclease of predicted toxin-antitoxin system
MDLDDKEREAIEAALRRLLSRNSLPAAYTSAWRNAGLREAVDSQALARPRSNRGATRA